MCVWVLCLYNTETLTVRVCHWPPAKTLHLVTLLHLYLDIWKLLHAYLYTWKLTLTLLLRTDANSSKSCCGLCTMEKPVSTERLGFKYFF